MCCVVIGEAWDEAEEAQAGGQPPANMTSAAVAEKARRSRGTLGSRAHAAMPMQKQPIAVTAE